MYMYTSKIIIICNFILLNYLAEGHSCASVPVEARGYLGSQFSPFIMLVLRIKLSSAGLVTSSVILRTVPPPPTPHPSLPYVLNRGSNFTWSSPIPLDWLASNLQGYLWKEHPYTSSHPPSYAL